MNKIANRRYIFKLHTTIMCDRKRFCNKLRKLQNVRIEREYSLQMITDEGITFSICTFHQQSLNIRNWDPHVNLVQPINHKRQCKWQDQTFFRSLFHHSTGGDARTGIFTQVLKLKSIYKHIDPNQTVKSSHALFEWIYWIRVLSNSEKLSEYQPFLLPIDQISKPFHTRIKEWAGYLELANCANIQHWRLIK